MLPDNQVKPLLDFLRKQLAHMLQSPGDKKEAEELKLLLLEWDFNENRFREATNSVAAWGEDQFYHPKKREEAIEFWVEVQTSYRKKRADSRKAVVKMANLLFGNRPDYKKEWASA